MSRIDDDLTFGGNDWPLEHRPPNSERVTSEVTGLSCTGAEEVGVLNANSTHQVSWRVTINPIGDEYNAQHLTIDRQAGSTFRHDCNIGVRQEGSPGGGGGDEGPFMCYDLVYYNTATGEVYRVVELGCW